MAKRKNESGDLNNEINKITKEVKKAINTSEEAKRKINTLFFL